MLAIAEEVKASPDQIAIKWATLSGAFPIVGPRSREQLLTNLGAVDIHLDADQIKRLDDVSKLLF